MQRYESLEDTTCRIRESFRISVSDSRIGKPGRFNANAHKRKENMEMRRVQASGMAYCCFLPLFAWISSTSILCYGWTQVRRHSGRIDPHGVTRRSGPEWSHNYAEIPLSVVMSSARQRPHSSFSEAGVGKNKTLTIGTVLATDVVNADLLNRMEGATPVELFDGMLRTKRRQSRNQVGWYSSDRPPVNLRRESAQIEQRGSVQRAIDQVDAIVRLYNATTGDGKLSPDVVLSALESLLLTCCDRLIHGDAGQRMVSQSSVTSELLERLEDLVWKLGECKVAPSTIILESLWSLQQSYTYRLDSQNGRLIPDEDGPTSDAKPSRQVGRRIRLLSEWVQWEMLVNMDDAITSYRHRSHLAPLPVAYFLEVFDYSLDHKVTMSYAMWDLYRSLHDNHRKAQPLPVDLYASLLKLIASSSNEWKDRECRVLQDMVVQARRCNDSMYAPTSVQVSHALEHSVRAGRIVDVAWLLRQLPNGDPVVNHQLTFLKALSRCREPGSTLYMERLVDQWSEVVGIDGYKLLLEKLVTSRAPQQGARAHEAFKRIHLDHCRSSEISENGRLDEWKPNAQLVYLVVQAYLRDPGDQQLERVKEADQFVRFCVKQGYLQQDSCSLVQKPHQQRYPYRAFDKLLQAYTSVVTPEAHTLADQLIQFFLTQHRDGRVAEEPDSYHLGHVLRLWNRKSLGGVGAYKSLEYLHLFDSVRNRGLSAFAQPDEFNIRQVLGTLARSDVQGLGDEASRLLDRVLANEELRSDGYALGHMFYCVVKCFCNDRTLSSVVKAMDTLDRMERIHDKNPKLVQVTGAAYQTVLKTLAAILKTTAGSTTDPDAITVEAESVTIAEMAREVVGRIERQSECGNKRARLTRSIYLDAIRCCKTSPGHEHLCSSYRDKLATLRR